MICFSVVLSTFPVFANESELPNILWITCEDTGQELGCYGDKYAETPHLDQLIIYVPEKFKNLAPPAYKPGDASNRLVSFVDLAPTLLSLAGIKPPEWMQGCAFMGRYEAPPRKYLYGFRGRMDERYDMVRSVRNERYVYIRNCICPYIQGIRFSYRLARNSADWHRLLELCAMTDTLILDEDGLYDPNQFNDRLLLGLLGTMSEAELHFLWARLYGGKLNKARRGELRTMLPAGLIYDPEGRVQLDPDRQVQQAFHKVFKLFERHRSAWQVVCQLQQAEIRLPVRLRVGSQAGETIWTEATLSRVLHILKNPRYVGMYFYGRTRQRKGVSVAAQQISLLCSV